MRGRTTAADEPTGRLRKRSEFLAAAAGRKHAAGSLVLQCLARDSDSGGTTRFGFTVTRKVGNAVERNRVRRRLRAAVSQVGPYATLPGHDYVLIGRRATLTAPFAQIVQDLASAFSRVHEARGANARRQR